MGESIAPVQLEEPPSGFAFFRCFDSRMVDRSVVSFILWLVSPFNTDLFHDPKTPSQ